MARLFWPSGRIDSCCPEPSEIVVTSANGDDRPRKDHATLDDAGLGFYLIDGRIVDLFKGFGVIAGS